MKGLFVKLLPGTECLRDITTEATNVRTHNGDLVQGRELQDLADRELVPKPAGYII